MKHFALLGSWVLFGLTVSSAALGAELELRGTADSAAKSKAVAIAGVIEQLSTEANELEVVKDPKAKARLRRPHPLLTAWGAESAPDILKQMREPFLGNAYRDTYIRWHLMYVLKQMDASDRLTAGPDFVRLIKQMPGPVAARLLPEWRDDPEDVAAQYRSVQRKTRVRVGYPPFEKDYWGRDALEHVSGEKRTELKKLVEEMELLRSQWKRVYDSAAVSFNKRVRKVNMIIRQYRGELIYELLRTGDPKMLSLVVEEIGRQVESRQRVAFDLMSFMYQGATDGVFDQYDPQTLAGLSRRLKRIAQRAEGYDIYMLGEKEPPAYDHLRSRNFADYAFHMVHLLGNIDVVSATGSRQPTEASESGK